MVATQSGARQCFRCANSVCFKSRDAFGPARATPSRAKPVPKLRSRVRLAQEKNPTLTNVVRSIRAALSSTNPVHLPPHSVAGVELPAFALPS